MKTVLLTTQQVFLDKIEIIFGFIVVFLMPQATAFLAVGILIAIDFFTGIWASWKADGIASITSKRMKDSVTKMIMYNALIITCMVTEAYLITRIPFIEVGLGIIATVETKSIFENIEKVLNIKIIRAFKEVFHRGKNANKNQDTSHDS